MTNLDNTNHELEKDICFEIMKQLEIAHDLLRKLPESESKSCAYGALENAHTYIQNLANLPSEESH